MLLSYRPTCTKIPGLKSETWATRGSSYLLPDSRQFRLVALPHQMPFSSNGRDMPIPEELKSRLVTALETGNLMFLCGAGLSMPAPSSLPSAVAVAEECFDRWNVVEPLAPELRQDIEKLADFFYQRGDFVSTFIEHVVPWNNLVGAPNLGHAAVADFLICRAVHGVLSSNFDPLIENWAAGHKLAMRGALDGIEAVNFQGLSNPLLKFHGCMQRGREQTVWTASQFVEPAIRDRMQWCSDWMRLNLPGRHLVVIGFWSDWDYLNQVFSDAFAARGAVSVTIVNRGSTNELQRKASDLWEKLSATGPHFTHVQMSSDDFLVELRQEFSEIWYRKLVARGRTLWPVPAGAPPAPAAVSGLSVDDLYDLRRDMQATPYTHSATLREPEQSACEASSIRLRLQDRGATSHRSWLRLNGQSVRVINGAGRSLQEVQRGYKEAPTDERADTVVCAGSINLGVPNRIISEGTPMSFVRPASGTGATWMTTSEVEVAFGL
jgi:hypothetical protein